MKLKLYKDSFDGKQLYYGSLSEYLVYVNNQIVESLNKDDMDKQTFEINLPIHNCDIVEINKDVLVIVPGNKILYYLEHKYYEIVQIGCKDCKPYSNSKKSTLILSPGKAKLHCQIIEGDETRNIVILLHPDGKTESIPDEKILEYV